jgi:hypothetical protein
MTEHQEEQGTPESYERVRRGEVAAEVETAEVLRAKSAETASDLAAKSAETASDIASVTEALRDLRSTISETIDTAIVDRLDVLERRVHERTFAEVRQSRVRMILVIATAIVGAIILTGIHAHECVGGPEMIGVRQALCDITQPTHHHGATTTVWQLGGIIVYVGGLAGLWAWLSSHLDRS